MRGLFQGCLCVGQHHTPPTLLDPQLAESTPPPPPPRRRPRRGPVILRVSVCVCASVCESVGLFFPGLLFAFPLAEGKM